MKGIHVLLFLFLLTVLLHGCRWQPSSETLYIVQSSDIHGAILPHDFVRDTAAGTSLAHAMHVIREFRESGGVVLLDNGDILQGQPLVYYSNFVDTARRHICSDVMNYMGVDAATVGNHDIEAGHGVYDRLREEFRFPWLAANVIDRKTGEPYFTPYAVIRKAGWKIAVLGLTTPAVPQWLPEKLWEGMEFRDMLETAREWVPVILEKEQPDLMVGLFHTGTGTADETVRMAENAGRQVATRVSGFDIVFTGHDHRAVQTTVVNVRGDSVLILNPGSHAAYLSVVEVRMENGRPVLSPLLVPLEEVPADREFVERYRGFRQEVEDYLSQPVGKLTRSVYAREAIFGDAAFTDLIHRIQMDVSGAPVSFTAPLAMDARVPAGEITIRDLFALYRYENFLYAMELRGSEIRDYLEYSYAGWFDTMTGPGDHLLLFRKDENGEPVYAESSRSYRLARPPYNFDSAEGLEYLVDVSTHAGERVQILSMEGGAPFYPDSLYPVAVNSYRGSGGGGHLTAGAGIPPEKLADRIKWSTPHDLRQSMIEWFREQGTVEPACSDNWTVIPESWVARAKKRDFALLFHESITLN
ncbi:MAG: bifunctional metallophosphatase/5'-nucleotidase [Bacteroidales bacterium]